MMYSTIVTTAIVAALSLVSDVSAKKGKSIIEGGTDMGLGVIVRLDRGKEPESFKSRMKIVHGDKFDEKLEGEVSGGFESVLAINTDPDVLDNILEDEDVNVVEYVQLYQIARPHETRRNVNGISSWHMDRINQRSSVLDSDEQLEAGKKIGKDVNVYIVDTGVDIKHKSLKGANHFYNDFPDEGPEDFLGHGTHVAGLVAAQDYGPATNAQIQSVKVLDKSGFGTTLTIISGLNRVLNEVLKYKVSKKGAKKKNIVVMSLSGPPSNVIDALIVELYLANVLVVVAAGNDAGDSCSVTPGRNPAALTVAATDASDLLAPFTNVGPCVDILAPGSDIVSLASGGGTQVYSGTSMAASIVAGVAASLWSQEKNLSARQVRRIMLMGTTFLEGVTHPTTQNRFVFADAEVEKTKLEDFTEDKILFVDLETAAGFDGTGVPDTNWDEWLARRRRYRSNVPDTTMTAAEIESFDATRCRYRAFYVEDTDSVLVYSGVAVAEIKENGEANLNGMFDHLNLVDGAVDSISIVMFLHVVGVDTTLTAFNPLYDDGTVVGPVAFQDKASFEAARRRYRG
ncbi:hypothetical protein SARC_11516 [Sphaeroforma arctica JP610]|uniref:Peptidase S8/S53 domain-containing protein n=1 Tax=Sphaeroforma arctica JP610 TaxID=667725 RepID=A0A0L0FHM5_9EUKA|nr:hypothetical protein SARC_11516 [Sphaeroforma arctica JP610]KNC75971.1 hypothetical protein SARC_11516 [Sphaeroforma arctica JP610]|eukprot:XP_014149873.1 hypothetical protein SARC_11516 [Sphaeroforma arctica JP610]